MLKLDYGLQKPAPADYTQDPGENVDLVPILTNTSKPNLRKSTPLTFGVADDLFGWLHYPSIRTDKPSVVICNPLGHEYIRAHRSLRTLAQLLSDAGHHVLRFDYRTTGDSAGSEQDPSRFEDLMDSLEQACECVQQHSANKKIILLGLRFGATLAAKYAETENLDFMVLWAPCESGAIYVREQQIMAAAQKKRLTDKGEPPGDIEGVDAGGFLLTPDAQNSLSQVTLEASAFNNRPDILIANRDDLRVSYAFAKKLENMGATVNSFKAAGYREMMQPPQLSKVPEQAINEILDVFKSRYPSTSKMSTVQPDNNLPAKTVLQSSPDCTEHLYRFGNKKNLFGIITNSGKSPIPQQAAVIFLCGGATHRISANRMYVDFARKLAEKNITSLRMDLAGIGDSLPHEGKLTGKPYSTDVVHDVKAAMDTIREHSGHTNFILFGLCSGAYAAFQTALQEPSVKGLILANQLVYSLTPKQLKQLENGEIKSAHSIDFPRSKSLTYRMSVKLLQKVSPYWSFPGYCLAPWLLGCNPQADFNRLLSRGTQISIVQSSIDEAVTALEISCGRFIEKSIRKGGIKRNTFHGTDHTFSPTFSQNELSDWLVTDVCRMLTQDQSKNT